jgi:hypothetical protein
LKTIPTRPISLSAAAVGNLVVIGFVGGAALLISAAPDLYNRSVQEDEVLEWATFWSFVGAAWILAATARQKIRDQLGWPWFLAGLAAFCLLVALEEISWGQRIIGFRPSAFFLGENFQQEMNLHNTVSDSLRQYGFLLVCWGYGVILPIAARASAARRLLDRVGVVAPPLELTPAFAVTAIFYQIYPWSHTGEWAEAMLGSALLCVAVLERDRGRATPEGEVIRTAGVRLAGVWLLTALLGVATARLGWVWTAQDPERLEQARIELTALREDVASARTRTRCGLHKRIFTMVKAYEMDHLFEGAFASLQGERLPEDRARYFMDPWNSPYWVQHACSEDHRRRAIFVYSFGPDRKRDSTEWEIIEDDLGAWISRPRIPAGD